ncbi:HAD-IA family hydrolase [Moraxella sp. Tifton1]|uniref:HAD family hydrolase n=1 Tax=Moraxella oculi TaxID=2940516 RepID=UPI0020133EE0|nr:HAD-IA family hydrolase [Moraxella sp. Tifton1]MCL1623865.1 HAD-IA family hydrolase [Moraxella sp. Tifton1]
MMTKINAVLFDLDGTLIDTAPDFIRIIRLMCQKYNLPIPSDADIREQVSAGARAMVRLIFGDEMAQGMDTNEKMLAYRQEFLALYEQDICVDSRLFDGLDRLLVKLENQGVPWGIVTNKPRHLATQLLTKLHLNNRCSVLVCPDDVINTKPDPEPMFLAVNRLNARFGTKILNENCIYVGDHIRDIQAGNLAGMTTVVAKFGYLSCADKDNLHEWGADVLIDTPDELADWVLAMLGE